MNSWIMKLVRIVICTAVALSIAPTLTAQTAVSSVSGTPYQVATTPTSGNVTVSLPSDKLVLPETTLFSMGPAPHDSATLNQMPPRAVIQNWGAYDELYGQDILRLYADYNGTGDDRPSFRMDSGGYIHIQRAMTLSGDPNPQYANLNGQYMLGIVSGQLPSNPLIALRPPVGVGIEWAKQPFIYGLDVNGVESYVVQADGTIGAGNAKPTVTGGHFHNSGNTIRFVDKKRTPSNSNEACYLGEMSFDSNYVYVCVANNKWKRLPLLNF